MSERSAKKPKFFAKRNVVAKLALPFSEQALKLQLKNYFVRVFQRTLSMPGWRRWLARSLDMGKVIGSSPIPGIKGKKIKK